MQLDAVVAHWLLPFGLVAAAALWWDLMQDGVTLRGIAIPGLLTGLGVFWLLVAARRRTADPDRGP